MSRREDVEANATCDWWPFLLLGLNRREGSKMLEAVIGLSRWRAGPLAA